MAKIIQLHHIQYEHPERKSMQDVVVPVYKGEHLVLTKIQWFCKNGCSKGFIKALKVFIAMNEDEAVDAYDA